MVDPNAGRKRALDAAGFAAYARQQIVAADLILARHDRQGVMCGCGRTVPCSQAIAVLRRREHFVAQLVRLGLVIAVGRARVRGRG